jgi:hypothetical protein
MSIALKIKINNQTVIYDESNNPIPIKVISNKPVITWEYDSTNIVTLEPYGIIDNIGEPLQSGYEIRISTYNINIGYDTFIASYANTSYVLSENRFWTYAGYPLNRGGTYYGQILIKDQFNNVSSWFTFSFEYNSLPSIDNISITPSLPDTNTDLELSYDFIDDDADIEATTIIRWYKNGVRQKQFDNIKIIKNYFLQIDDIWYAEVVPNDGYEYGLRATAPFVKVTTIAPEISNVKIMPINPNENDILSVDYSCSDFGEYDNVTIKWFINNRLISKFNDYKFIRYAFEVGDIVRYEIKPINGGNFVSSEIKTIESSIFTVYDIKIDGQEEPLNISTLSPVIRWKIHKPSTLNANYASIKIGTFYEADNIWPPIDNTELGILETNKDFFNIPANLLNKGMDYYISIAVSDTTDFNNYTSAHFRTNGSHWDTSVSNTIGWTIETIFMIENPGIFNEAEYQIVRFHDGTKFGEVRIYNQKIGFVSDSFVVSDILTTSGFNILTITGINDDVKIYLNRTLVIDGTGLFNQNTTSGTKKLEIGNSNSISFGIKYKYFYYTTAGAYFPDSSAEYSDIKFYKFLEFKGNEIVALNGYVSNLKDYKIFGVNPDKTDESSSIYAIVPEYAFKAGSVSRTFVPINKIRESPDGSKRVFAHGNGASIIVGYTINPFDVDLNLIVEAINYDISYPNQQGWDLVDNTFNTNVAYFDTDGLHINTLT